MAKFRLIEQFETLSIDELKEELKKRKEELCKAVIIQEMDEILEEVEALEFLIRDKKYSEKDV